MPRQSGTRGRDCRRPQPECTELCGRGCRGRTHLLARGCRCRGAGGTGSGLQESPPAQTGQGRRGAVLGSVTLRQRGGNDLGRGVTPAPGQPPYAAQVQCSGRSSGPRIRWRGSGTPGQVCCLSPISGVSPRVSDTGMPQPLSLLSLSCHCTTWHAHTRATTLPPSLATSRLKFVTIFL